MSCSKIAGGGEECYGHLNAVYPAIILVSLAGIVLFCSATLGRRFVLSPPYAVGMITLGIGFAGMTFQYLSLQWCEHGALLSCVSTDSLVFEMIAVMGLTMLGVAGYRRLEAQ